MILYIIHEKSYIWLLSFIPSLSVSVALIGNLSFFSLTFHIIYNLFQGKEESTSYDCHKS